MDSRGEMETPTGDARGSLRDGRGTKYAVDKLDEGMGIYGGCGYFSQDLILSVLVRAKLVRNRRVVESLAAIRWPFSLKSFPFRLSRDYRSEIRDEFGLMAENKLLFLEFPRERFPYSESTPV